MVKTKYKGRCKCCECLNTDENPLTKHHTIPVSMSPKNNSTIIICRRCHDKIHNINTLPKKKIKKQESGDIIIMSKNQLKSEYLTDISKFINKMVIVVDMKGDSHEGIYQSVSPDHLNPVIRTNKGLMVVRNMTYMSIKE